MTKDAQEAQNDHWVKFVNLLLLASLPRLLSAETAGSKPNIIFALFDDLGFGQPGWRGGNKGVDCFPTDVIGKRSLGFAGS